MYQASVQQQSSRLISIFPDKSSVKLRSKKKIMNCYIVVGSIFLHLVRIACRIVQMVVWSEPRERITTKSFVALNFFFRFVVISLHLILRTFSPPRARAHKKVQSCCCGGFVCVRARAQNSLLPISMCCTCKSH